MTLSCLFVQTSALAELHRYLAVLVHLAGLGCQLDDINTSQWPAAATAATSSENNSHSRTRLLIDVWADVTAAQRTQLRQQRTSVQHHAAVQGPASQPLSVSCLSELVLALVQLPSARDALLQNEQFLFEYVAEALAECGGLTARENSANSTTPAAAAQLAPSVAVVAGSKMPEGYSSPGLLHLLLGSHIRVLLDASSERGTPAAHSRAVNSLHLLRALFAVPGVWQDYGQQLLLPCVARPLMKLLAAGTSCLAAKYQVLLLLQQLLGKSLTQQHTPQQEQAGSGSGQSVGL